jgi:hypothetical protein
MVIYKAPDEFLVKLYEWARADFRREIEEGFPLLRGIENRTTYGIIGIMESLPKAKSLCEKSLRDCPIRVFKQRIDSGTRHRLV